MCGEGCLLVCDASGLYVWCLAVGILLARVVHDRVDRITLMWMTVNGGKNKKEGITVFRRGKWERSR